MKDIMTFASTSAASCARTSSASTVRISLEGGGRDNKMVTDNIQDNPNALDPVECKLVLPPTDVKAKP